MEILVHWHCCSFIKIKYTCIIPVGVISSQFGRFATLPLDNLTLGRLLLLGYYAKFIFDYSVDKGNTILLDFTLLISNGWYERFRFDLNKNEFWYYFYDKGAIEILIFWTYKRKREVGIICLFES